MTNARQSLATIALTLVLPSTAWAADTSPQTDAWRQSCPNAVEMSDADPIVLPPVKGKDIVRVRAVVGPDGNVLEARVVSTTNPKMNDTALSGVRKWRWRKPTKDGKPVCAAVEVDIEFKHD
jgi:TonB family protein